MVTLFGVEMERSKFIIVLVMAILLGLTGAAAVNKAMGSSLSKEPPSILVNGPPMNLTADDQDIDISIDPLEPILVPNGTLSIPIAGATDVDINEFPPFGVTVLIDNQSVTVTKNPVSIDMPGAAITNDEESSNGNEDEGDE